MKTQRSREEIFEDLCTFGEAVLDVDLKPVLETLLDIRDLLQPVEDGKVYQCSRAGLHKTPCKDCKEVTLKVEPSQPIDVVAMLDEYAQVYGGFGDWHEETLAEKTKKQQEIISIIKKALER